MRFPILHFQRENPKSHPIKIPESVWNQPESLEEIYIQGSLQAFELLQRIPEYGLAIVGTRNPQPRSVAFLKKSISDLSRSNLIIISGFARGIDTVAHTTSLEVGLPTIAILGAGLEVNYPKENWLLRNRILEGGGLLVSEFAPQVPALAHHFLKRNRIIAGWSKATWVVEAAFQSGALNTARWARDQNKICFSTPCYPGDPKLEGNQVLLDRDHAVAYWGASSLGAVWLELSTQAPSVFLKKETHNASSSKEVPDKILTLYNKIRQMTFDEGGADLRVLMDWAVSQNWSLDDFFSALQTTVHKKLVLERRGTFVSI